MDTSLITYQAHPFKIKHNIIQYMNPVTYDIQCLKCKMCVFILILIMFFASLLLIIFCDICYKGYRVWVFSDTYFDVCDTHGVFLPTV